MRKAGKLPGPVKNVSYGKEYGPVCSARALGRDRDVDTLGRARADGARALCVTDTLWAWTQDTLEMQADALVGAPRVLLVDDVLATGGTANAACDLVRALGGTVVGLSVLLELPALGGRKRLPPTVSVCALLER